MTDWHNIVTEHGPVVWKTVYRLLGDADLARDCYQETFLAAMKMSESAPVENWQAMLRTIGTRKAIDALRARVRARSREHSGVDPEHVVTSHAPGQGSQIVHLELVDAVRDVLARIPDRQAEAFALRHFEQMDNPEIADRLGTTPRNVSVLIHRAVARLQQDLPASVRQNNDFTSGVPR
ncbi:RNA polymerase sigma factor [Algisphaera agarilytica]|uniref:RNA polymerase sigma-70 factor (ECF subfamily) n=1 Tax=Algisphaera agarilytica TaxID=1385975 RepID=A0A7X0LJ04_9BACT|nr:sigma-70 family RNA polymerase sigma factor [Algisphaera agarilytica]MBB6428342.1 RNA polymerase sigma-70 factor (ECF subfamily) [Algisphaera agarilytica]